MNSHYNIYANFDDIGGEQPSNKKIAKLTIILLWRSVNEDPLMGWHAVV